MTELNQASVGVPGVPTGSETSPSKRKLTPKRLIVIFVACLLGTLGGTWAANALNGSSGSGGSSAMGTWFARYGANYMQVSHDAAKVNLDANTASVGLPTIRADCERLATDVAMAQGNPPMPDGTLQLTWSGILVQLKNAAQLCISGIDNQSGAQMTQAGVDMNNAGAKYLQLAKEVTAMT